MNETELTKSVLMKHKEVWIDKLRYKRNDKKIMLVKMIERGKRIMNNKIFGRFQQSFLKRIKDSTEYELPMVSGKKRTLHLMCH